MESFTKAWGGIVDVLRLNFSLSDLLHFVAGHGHQCHGTCIVDKGVFCSNGLKTDWKKAWENSLMAASWWILGMFNKIKQRMDEILTPSAFFCRIDLRMSTVNLWWNRKQALYPQLRAASKEEPSKVQLPVRISVYLNMCNSVTSTKICLWAYRCFGVFFIPSDSKKLQ